MLPLLRVSPRHSDETELGSRILTCYRIPYIRWIKLLTNNPPTVTR